MNRRSMLIFAVVVAAVIFGYYFRQGVKTINKSPSTLHVDASEKRLNETLKDEGAKNSVPTTSYVTHFGGKSVDYSHVGSLEEWINNYSPAQQKLILDFSKKYRGVFQISAPSQISWMHNHGYLLPEDVTESSTFTIADLKSMSEKGDGKATMLLYDKLIDDYVSSRDNFVALGGRREDFNSLQGKDKALEIMSLKQKLTDLNSPFSFFLKMRDAELSQVSDPFAIESGILSGLLAAQQGGDVRGVGLIRQCVSDGICGSSDVGIATAIANAMNEAYGMNNARVGCNAFSPDQMPSK